MKRTRQNKILELINQYEIETQEDLAGYLQQAGFSVTQATISRDIKEMALTKVTGRNGRPKYAVMGYDAGVNTGFSGRHARVLQDGMISMVQADNILVIKTVSGMAMAVAVAVDALGLDEIAGSIAGDDTIMCAIKSADLVPGVMKKLQNNKEL